MPTHSTNARDAALQRLRRTNRWLIAGSVVLTGVLSDVAANAFAGKTIKAGANAKKSGGSSSAGSSRVKAQPLSPPAQAPQGSTTTEAPPSQESSQAAPSQESQQSAPESSQQPAPSQESQQPAPSQEAAPSQQAAPSQEAAPPAVSGGS
ncbi:MAG TPA: hypothetical protein VNZ01_11000 [Solirubrobacteraceae bacterium]|jgi:hypothetical protein|nr:hypothetical protein [Solirubrobacteraceae bacterium]